MAKDSMTSRRTAVGFVGAAIAAVPAAARAEATPIMVVFHVSDPDHWAPAISNLSHITAAYPEGKFRVVVDGPAVLALQGENHVTDALAPIAEKGVLFQVCPNALKDQGVPADGMPAWAATDVIGVLALFEAQRADFAYIKP